MAEGKEPQDDPGRSLTVAVVLVSSGRDPGRSLTVAVVLVSSGRPQCEARAVSLMVGGALGMRVGLGLKGPRGTFLPSWITVI